MLGRTLAGPLHTSGYDVSSHPGELPCGGPIERHRRDRARENTGGPDPPRLVRQSRGQGAVPPAKPAACGQPRLPRQRARERRRPAGSGTCGGGGVGSSLLFRLFVELIYLKIRLMAFCRGIEPEALTRTCLSLEPCQLRHLSEPVLARREGLEPPTYEVETRNSIQLSYRR